MITITYNQKEYSANSWTEFRERFPKIWNSHTGATRIREHCTPVMGEVFGEVLRITWSKVRPKYPSKCSLEIVHIQDWKLSPQFALTLGGQRVAKKTLYAHTNSA